jgi:hypothetical protein
MVVWTINVGDVIGFCLLLPILIWIWHLIRQDEKRK